MKRIKLTPILLIFPISIIAFIVNIRRHWTAFSFYFIIGFILITAVINLFMGSASAKWAIMEPVFIPMFLKLNIDPAIVQTAYRIADSSTNLISPLMSYFAMIIVFTQVYDKKAGIGTITSMMLPYSMTFLIAWSLMLIVWVSLGIPVGF